MKVVSLLALCAAVPTWSVNLRVRDSVSEVVKMLEEMMKQSQEDGVSDREAFAKFKCHCDTQTERLKKSIENETQTIELLNGQISENQGENGILSLKLADLKQSLEENEQVQLTAEKKRSEQKKHLKRTKETSKLRSIR